MKLNPQKLSLKLQAFLTHRHLPWFAATLGMLLGLPALWSGWGVSDDVMHREFLLTASLPQALSRLYLFLDPAINLQRMDSGIYPWWTFENARVLFFRPLSAFSLWLDYQIWPNSNFLMHLHSLVVYGVLCFVAVWFYRRLAGNTPASGLAGILFSVSIPHFGCIVSLAGRNLLLTAIFGFLTIWFHHRFRRDGWRPGWYLAPLCLALSLLSAEMGVATFAYLLAYAVFLDEAPFRKRLASVLPYALMVGIWWVLYNHFNFGAQGSGFYLDPAGEPLTFLASIVQQVPMLLIGQWFFFEPVFYAVLSGGIRLISWVLSLGVLAWVVVLLVPQLKTSRLARFWGGGILLSVFLVCAANPATGRHLMFVGIGAFGLMATFIASRLFEPRPAFSRRSYRVSATIMCFILLGLHLFLYPLLYPVVSSSVRKAMDAYSSAVSDLANDPWTSDQDVVIVNSPSPGQMIYLPGLRQLRNLPMPAHLRILAPGFSDVQLTTLDDHTLVVRSQSDYLLSPKIPKIWELSFFPIFNPVYAFQFGDALFRGAAYPMTVGQKVELTGVQMEVLSLTPDGRPLLVYFHFDEPLADTSRVWLSWDWQSFQYLPFTLPPVGESVTLSGPY